MTHCTAAGGDRHSVSCGRPSGTHCAAAGGDRHSVRVVVGLQGLIVLQLEGQAQSHRYHHWKSKLMSSTIHSN